MISFRVEGMRPQITDRIRARCNVTILVNESRFIKMNGVLVLEKREEPGVLYVKPPSGNLRYKQFIFLDHEVYSQFTSTVLADYKRLGAMSTTGDGHGEQI